MKEKLVLYWARRDLRLTDNPALSAACTYSREMKASFLPFFIIENYMSKGDPKHQFGYPSRVFLSKALPIFAKQFENFILLTGPAAKTIIKLSENFDLSIFVNEDIYPDFYKQIKKIKSLGIDIKLYTDTLTINKQKVSGAKTPYSVFTPFKNSVWQEFIEAPVLKKCSFENVTFLTKNAVSLIKNQIPCLENKILNYFSDTQIFSVGGEKYDIKKIITQSIDFDNWYYSEKDSHLLFDTYLKEQMPRYKETRDSLGLDSTSKMSLALAWGLVSSRFLVKEIKKHFNNSFNSPFPSIEKSNEINGATHYISELIWREFYKYLFFHNQKLIDQEFQEKYRGTLKWVEGVEAKVRFEAWISGQTGYPLVDAAMNQLAKTGWMHNRARMLVASVLTKNLGIDWRWGQEYFRAMLIDLDDASNNGGWQWAASVGADPKPIRIFNPYLQAKSHDSQNIYQEKYLSADYLNNPPKLIIEHKDAREEALKRYRLKNDQSIRDF